MRILIVLGHPGPGSLNHAIAHAVRDDLRFEGHDVVFHDLYAEQFDPLLVADEIPESGNVTSVIQSHCDDLCSADGIVIVHPNWWGQPPAILKGWVDRVVRPGVAYRFAEGDNGEGIPIGLLRLEHLEYAGGQRTDVLWRSLGSQLAAVYLRSLWRWLVLPQDVYRCGDKHFGSTEGMDRRGQGTLQKGIRIGST